MQRLIIKWPALKVLSEAGADLNARNNNGLSALHLAVNKGHVDFLECLLTMKAHPSLQVRCLECF